MSDKPLAERLQVKGTRRLAVLGATPELDHAIGVSDRRALLAEADVILLMVPDRTHLDAELPKVLATAQAVAILWVAYPKLSSPLVADLSRDVIHATGSRPWVGHGEPDRHVIRTGRRSG